MKTKCFFEEISTEEILSINGGGLTSTICNDIINIVAQNGYCSRSKDSFSEDRLRKVTNKLMNNGYVIRIYDTKRGKYIHVTKINN